MKIEGIVTRWVEVQGEAERIRWIGNHAVEHAVPTEVESQLWLGLAKLDAADTRCP
jgi:hypothetical protein